MNRVEVYAAFSVVSGEIKSAGPYEGAPVFAPFFYTAYRQGRRARATQRRNEGLLALVYDVTEADRVVFPELENVIAVRLFVDAARALEFVALDPIFRRLGGRRPNVEDEEEADEG